jgi:putative phosphoribosyl transferase
MLLDDRRHAGILLAAQLEPYRAAPDTLVLALPRGGVIVACQVSQALQLPLDVVITRKVGLPECPEYAVAAVSETGFVYRNPDAADALSEEQLAGLVDAQRHEISRRQALYRHGRSLPALRNLTLIIVDDGIATGSTFLATVQALAQLSPRRIVAAIPVSPVSTAAKIRALVDHCVILDTPEPFRAVSEFFQEFQQVDDEEVIRCLMQAAQTFRDRPHDSGEGHSLIPPHPQKTA